MTDMWPTSITEPTTVTPPIAVLKKAAMELSKKTNGLLTGHIETAAAFPTLPGSSDLTHAFFIVATALNEYQYKLLDVRHGINLYPANVHPREGLPNDLNRKAENPEKLERALQEVFASPKVVEIVQSLLAQSKAA